LAVEIESYLMEIQADNVSGEDLEYDADFIALEQDAQGKEEQIMGDSVIEAEAPNWLAVLKKAELLLRRTHDLRIFVYYLRALTQTQGYLGLADGMQLLKRASEKFWSSMHPQLDPDDDNDPTERINILMSLCDFETFLNPLQNMVLIESKGIGSFSLKDIQIANGSIIATKTMEDLDLPQLATIDAAFQECDADELIANANAVAAILTDLNQLESYITEQVGVNDAPSFTEVRDVLKTINTIFSEHIEKRGINNADEGLEAEISDEQNEDLAGSNKSEKAVVPHGINNDQDVLKALNLICEYYKKNEPSSPVPILIERVTRLVGKGFLEVIQDLAPNGVEQVEFLRGISDNDE